MAAPSYLDAPSALARALATFQTLDEPTYASKQLGSSHQLEEMTCTCELGAKTAEGLCGDENSCINRGTLFECISPHPNLGKCENRRIQDRLYADIDVIDAGKKGFGVCARSPIAENGLVQEYIGEVIDRTRYEKRRQQYAARGVAHFYFMSLTENEFIDATMKGSIARFINHSCSPNAYVEKWVVGPRMRMAIFAKRPIEPGEEITFNYNVDRFGDEAQPCYCGEPNCLGILGGKTQSGGPTIPRVYCEGLALTENDIASWREAVLALQVNKKERVFNEKTAAILPSKPLQDPSEVRPLMALIMQEREPIFVKLLSKRLEETLSQNVDAEIMRVHGYEILGNLLNQWQSETEVVLRLLHVLQRWPRMTRNKISSSKIETVVSSLTESDDQEVKQCSQDLLEAWRSLEMAYRIKRRRVDHPQAKSDSDAINSGNELSSAPNTPLNATSSNQSPIKGATPGGTNTAATNTSGRHALPAGWRQAVSRDGKIYYANDEKGLSSWERPRDSRELERERQRELEKKRIRDAEIAHASQVRQQQQAEIEKVIAEAEAQLLEQSSSQHSTEPSTPSKKVDKKPVRSKSVPDPVLAELAHYIPKLVFRYEDQLGRDKCRKYSKEIVGLLAEKEKRSGHKFELSDDKKTKIKGFVKSYIAKIMDHKTKKAKSSHDTKSNLHTTLV